MELKRILARDVKSANEKAVALYGNDVLVISSCQVRGQTELIVAVDIEPIPAELALQADEDTPIVRAAPASTPAVLRANQLASMNPHIQ